MPVRAVRASAVGVGLLAEDPEDAQGRMLQSAGLKTSGKFYAFVTGGGLVVKLPAGQVGELTASGAGRPCDPAGGRPMREWVRLSPPDQGTCAASLREGARSSSRAWQAANRDERSTCGSHALAPRLTRKGE